MPDTLAPQVPIIAEVLAALGIARIGAPGYEADDVIGTLATLSAGPVVIVTGDRDLFQLVDDARDVRVLYTGKGVAKAGRGGRGLAAGEVRRATGRATPTWPSCAATPRTGCPGSRASARRPRPGCCSGGGRWRGCWPPSMPVTPRSRSGPALEAARGYLEAAGPVVRVARDLELPDVSAAWPPEAADPHRLANLVERYGLRTSVARLRAALDAVG